MCGSAPEKALSLVTILKDGTVYIVSGGEASHLQMALIDRSCQIRSSCTLRTLGSVPLNLMYSNVE